MLAQLRGQGAGRETAPGDHSQSLALLIEDRQVRPIAARRALCVIQDRLEQSVLVERGSHLPPDGF